MADRLPVVVAAFEAKDEVRAVVEETLGDVSTLRFIHGAPPEARRAALAEARAVLAWRPHSAPHRITGCILRTYVP